jgi:hypothetical protein
VRLTNLTPWSAAQTLARDARGSLQVSVSVKGTWTWDDAGALVAGAPEPIRQEDEYEGDPARSGLLRAAELGPRKPRVDVLLEGALVFPIPVDDVLVTLLVGARVKKTLRVLGARGWQPGVLARLVPSRPRAETVAPIAWGTWPLPTETEAGPPLFDPGLAPRFEDPARPIRSATERTPPQGFGPVAPHWPARRRFVGTYDARWSAERAPLPPEDLDPRHFNVAPEDQQLDDYVPGEEVRIVYAERIVKDRFALPAFAIPVTFVGGGAVRETAAAVDTIVVDPRARALTLIARAAVTPLPNVLAHEETIVGALTPGRRRALLRGKRYLDRSGSEGGS